MVNNQLGEERGMYVYSGLSSCCVTCEVRMLCLESLNDFWIRGPEFLSFTGHQNYIVSPVYICYICISLMWRMCSTKLTNNNKIDKTLPIPYSQLILTVYFLWYCVTSLWLHWPMYVVPTWMLVGFFSLFKKYLFTWYSQINEVSQILLFFSRSVVSDSLWPHGLQHARLPCLSLSPTVCLDSCPVSQWCHLTISSSARNPG